MAPYGVARIAIEHLSAAIPAGNYPFRGCAINCVVGALDDGGHPLRHLTGARLRLGSLPGQARRNQRDQNENQHAFPVAD